MPPKLSIVCTDKKPLKQGQIRGPSGYCFKRGIKAGFAAGIKKGQMQNVSGMVALAPVPNLFEREGRPLLAIEDIPRIRAPLLAIEDIPIVRAPLLALPYEPPTLPELPRKPALVKKPKKKSLKALFETYKVGKSKARMRDMLLSLRFKNNEFNRVTAKDRRAMGPEITNWVLSSGEYSK